MEPGSSPDVSGITRLAALAAPGLHVVSISKPEPAMRQQNLVALFPSTEEARDAVLELEALEKGGEDNRVALVVMGSQPRSQHAGVDPEGVGRNLAPRTVAGALLGAVVGAALGAVVAAVSDSIGIAAAALGGAALFAVFGAVWGAFTRLGGSDAFRQTFVEPQARDVSVVSFHTDDPQRADEAFDRLAGDGDRSVLMLDQSLSTTLRTTAERAP